MADVRGQNQRRWAAPSVLGGFISSAVYKPTKGAEGAVDRISKCACAYMYKNTETDAPSAPSAAVAAADAARSCANAGYERGQLARPPPAPYVPGNNC